MPKFWTSALGMLTVAVLGVAGIPAAEAIVTSRGSVETNVLDLHRTGTGELTWHAQVTTEAIGPEMPGACSGASTCLVVLEAQDRDGRIGRMGWVSLTPEQEPFQVTDFSQTLAWFHVIRVRGAVVNGSTGTHLLVDDWIDVADDLTAPFVGTRVSDISRDTDGTLSWNVDAVSGGLGTSVGTCAAFPVRCVVVLEGRFSDGTTLQLGRALLTRDQLYRHSHTFAATARFPGDLVEIRAAVKADGESQNRLQEPWVPVSEWVDGGHDVEAAADMWASTAATLTAACIEAFPVGPHVAGSSLNDYQLNCLSARAAGGTWAEVFKQMITRFGASVIGEWLVNASYAVTPAPTESTLQSELWDWPGYPYADSTTPGAEAPPRPPAAPPMQDPVFENGLVASMVANGWTLGYGFQTLGSQIEHAREVARQCVALASWSNVVSEDNCRDRPIFSPGSDVIQAAQHDHDAIFGDGVQGRPDWIKLSYVTAAEKALTVPRGWYRSTCQGSGETSCDEYPFYTSVEGGPGASLRIINAAQNSLEGRLLYGFAVQCGIVGAAPGSEAREYLVVPLPYRYGPTTTGWCNR